MLLGTMIDAQPGMTPDVNRFKRWAPFEAAAIAVLNHDSTFELLDEARTVWLTISKPHALDPTSMRWKGGECDSETSEVITPPSRLDGWFANLQVEPAVAEFVSALVLTVDGPHGLTLVDDMGLDWA